MRPFAVPVFAFAIAATPAAAGTARVQISAVVPVSCSIDVIGVMPMEGRLALTVRRVCNTNHAVVLSAALDESIKDVTVRYNEDVVDMRGGQSLVAQRQRYFNGVDQLVMEMPSASAEQIQRYAASVSIGLETF